MSIDLLKAFIYIVLCFLSWRAKQSFVIASEAKPRHCERSEAIKNPSDKNRNGVKKNLLKLLYPN